MQRKTPPTRTVSRPSYLLLLFGTYAVLCQLTFILLSVRTAPETVSLDVLRHRVIPWLEYPLMSLTLIFGGGALLEWVQK